MSNIYKHDFIESCGKGDCDGSCSLCTLSICKICKLFEGSLTTDCPGYDAQEWSSAIYADNADYKNGQWVNKKCDTDTIKINPCEIT